MAGKRWNGCGKTSGAKSSGIPHLAKNERDVGHPGFFFGVMKKGFLSGHKRI
jgi:hypothetical protein